MSSNAAAVRPSSLLVRNGFSRWPRSPPLIERASVVIASSGANARCTTNTSAPAVTASALSPTATSRFRNRICAADSTDVSP